MASGCVSLDEKKVRCFDDRLTVLLYTVQARVLDCSMSTVDWL